MQRFTPILVLLALAFCLDGCVYRASVSQGNLLKDEDVEQVQVGMTRSQVRFLLGTPMVEDLFNSNRWDYVYYLKIGRSGNVYRRHFVVYFEGDEAVRIEKILDTTPGAESENAEG